MFFYFGFDFGVFIFELFVTKLVIFFKAFTLLKIISFEISKSPNQQSTFLYFGCFCFCVPNYRGNSAFILIHVCESSLGSDFAPKDCLHWLRTKC